MLWNLLLLLPVVGLLSGLLRGVAALPESLCTKTKESHLRRIRCGKRKGAAV